MNKLKTMMLSTIAIVALTANAYAGSIGFGVTGSLAGVTAKGTELEGAVEKSQTTSVANESMLGSVFAEYTFDGDHGMSFGVDWIPTSANVNADTLSRTDTEASQEGTLAETAVSQIRSAQAEVDNYLTYYAELPLHGGLYAKGGFSTMDVNTLESIGSGKTYGNKSVDGTMWGIGYKNTFGSRGFYKVEGTHTTFDGFTINEAGQSTNSGQNSVTVSDLIVKRGQFSIGYSF